MNEKLKRRSANECSLLHRIMLIAQTLLHTAHVSQRKPEKLRDFPPRHFGYTVRYASKNEYFTHSANRFKQIQIDSRNSSLIHVHSRFMHREQRFIVNYDIDSVTFLSYVICI